MATFRIRRVEGVAPGEARVSWVGEFRDEYDAMDEARRLAEAEKNPAVCEYVVWQTFPKNPPINKATFPCGKWRTGQDSA